MRLGYAPLHALPGIIGEQVAVEVQQRLGLARARQRAGRRGRPSPPAGCLLIIRVHGHLTRGHLHGHGRRRLDQSAARSLWPQHKSGLARTKSVVLLSAKLVLRQVRRLTCAYAPGTSGVQATSAAAAAARLRARYACALWQAQLGNTRAPLALMVVWAVRTQVVSVAAWVCGRAKAPACIKALVSCGVHRHRPFCVVHLPLAAMKVHLGTAVSRPVQTCQALLYLSVLPHCQQSEAPSHPTVC